MGTPEEREAIQIKVREKVLSENDRLAAQLRQRWSERGLAVVNLVSSPGSGKTSLLERTLAAQRDKLRMAVIAGDVQTDNDAVRLAAAGGRIVRPIVTGGACHLDARMVSRVAQDLEPEELDLLFVENVGNLVCPSSYDLGEDLKIVLISTTEGDDKPLKYPGMFRRSSVMVINKIDLLGTSDFQMAVVKENALKINGQLRVFALSCRTGEGLEEWYDWLAELVAAKREASDRKQT